MSDCVEPTSMVMLYAEPLQELTLTHQSDATDFKCRVVHVAEIRRDNVTHDRCSLALDVPGLGSSQSARVGHLEVAASLAIADNTNPMPSHYEHRHRNTPVLFELEQRGEIELRRDLRSKLFSRDE